MVTLIALLATITVVALVWTFVPRKEREYLYSDDSQSAAAAYYQRTANGWFEKWDLRFRQTGGVPKSSTSVGRMVLIVAAATAVLLTLLLRNPVPGVLLAVLVPTVWWGFLGSQVSKREKRITSQLVDFLDGIRQALSAGGSLEAAIKAATLNTEPPLRYELDRLVAEIDAHVPLKVALRAMARRNSSRAMAFACATLEISSTNGADTVRKSLYGISTMIRKNEKTLEEVQRRTMVTRIAAKAFLITPILLLLMSMLMFGVYPWTTPIGIGILVFIFLSIAASQAVFTWLKRWQQGA